MKSKAVTENHRKFHKLLAWLGKDNKSAVQKYQSIRKTLTRKLYARGCDEAEELADETIDRVTKQIDVLAVNYVGDPSLYFNGVAKNVFLESTRRPMTIELTDKIPYKKLETQHLEKQSQHLAKCLKQLSAEDAKLVIEYYKKDKAEKIKHRKQMAEHLEISMPALRVKIFRIRKNLQKVYFDTVD